MKKGTPVQWLMLVVFVIILLFVTGSFLSENCSEIGNCKNCWKAVPVAVPAGSALCTSNVTCQAKPADQQYNAVVDTLMCACTEAKDSNYADSELNSEISAVLKEITGLEMGAEPLCENPGIILVKRLYD